MDTIKVTIKIAPETREKIKKNRIFKREPYDEIINRCLMILENMLILYPDEVDKLLLQYQRERLKGPKRPQKTM